MTYITYINCLTRGFEAEVD